MVTAFSSLNTVKLYPQTMKVSWKLQLKKKNGCIISVVPYESICASFNDLDCLQGGKSENHNEICIFDIFKIGIS